MCFSVRSLETITKMIPIPSALVNSSHFIHNSCFTYEDPSFFKCSTTAQTKHRITGMYLIMIYKSSDLEEVILSLVECSGCI